MNSKNMTLLILAAGLSVPFASQASAQSMGDDPTDQAPVEETEFPEERLPVSQSDNDPAPPVATPMTPQSGLVEQAGIGGQTAYGRAAVMELGGSAGLISSNDYKQVNFAPSVGYFIADNLELSTMLSAGYIKAGESDAKLGPQ